MPLIVIVKGPYHHQTRDKFLQNTDAIHLKEVWQKVGNPSGSKRGGNTCHCCCASCIIMIEHQNGQVRVPSEEPAHQSSSAYKTLLTRELEQAPKVKVRLSYSNKSSKPSVCSGPSSFWRDRCPFQSCQSLDQFPHRRKCNNSPSKFEGFG